jgi:hypothetical protein
VLDFFSVAHEDCVISKPTNKLWTTQRIGLLAKDWRNCSSETGFRVLNRLCVWAKKFKLIWVN